MCLHNVMKRERILSMNSISVHWRVHELEGWLYLTFLILSYLLNACDYFNKSQNWQILKVLKVLFLTLIFSLSGKEARSLLEILLKNLNSGASTFNCRSVNKFVTFQKFVIVFAGFLLLLWKYKTHIEMLLHELLHRI